MQFTRIKGRDKPEKHPQQIEDEASMGMIAIITLLMVAWGIYFVLIWLL